MSQRVTFMAAFAVAYLCGLVMGVALGAAVVGREYLRQLREAQAALRENQ